VGIITILSVIPFYFAIKSRLFSADGQIQRGTNPLFVVLIGIWKGKGFMPWEREFSRSAFLIFALTFAPTSVFLRGKGGSSEDMVLNRH
jgi:hypothetical protein